jgi:hypothetical protein
LIGVAAGLLLQARQVKVSQIQAVRNGQLELMKMALEHLPMASKAMGASDPESYSQGIYLNWRMKYFEMGYEMGYFTDASIKEMADYLFRNPIPRNWWAAARETYTPKTMRRHTRQFFLLVDDEFRRHSPAAESSSDTTSLGT